MVYFKEFLLYFEELKSNWHQLKYKVCQHLSSVGLGL